MRFANGSLLLLLAATSIAAAPDFTGEYVTNLGLLSLTQQGSRVEGTYGDGMASTLEGEVKGGKLVALWTAKSGSGSASLELNVRDGRLTGSWVRGDGSGRGDWNGWRKDPGAEKGRPAKFGGLWRSSIGILDLTQKGTTVTGTYGCQGWGKISGEVKGRRLYLKWSWPKGVGTGWLEQTRRGGILFGACRSDEGGSRVVFGHELDGYYRGVRPKAETIVKGVAGNGMTYYLRIPKGWRSSKKLPTVVLLHGMNMGAESYVATVSRVWPDVARNYVLVGIDGEQWADWSTAEDPRHNYSYVNWMGRSTYEGFPHTERESPALVAEVVRELKKKHRLDRIFVGGHSQGGYLTYVLSMHYPDLFDGAFPMAGGLIIQAEPDVFGGDERKDLRKAQRETPLAIVHGERDGSVPFSSSLYAHDRFLAHGFPMLRLFRRSVGHGFSTLPLPEAVRWLDALTTDECEVLVWFAEKAHAARRWRDVAAAAIHPEHIHHSGKCRRRLDEIAQAFDAEARPGADKFFELISANADGSWVDAFLDWRDDFEFAPSAKPAMDAYRKLRAEHEGPAKKLLAEARKAFDAGDRESGWAKRQEVVEKYYACADYRILKRWIAERE
jgi:predicted esterase